MREEFPLLIANLDWENWQDAMDPEKKPEGPKSRKVSAPSCRTPTAPTTRRAFPTPCIKGSAE